VGLGCVPNEHVDPCEGVDCAHHGTCDTDGRGFPTCQCQEGFPPDASGLLCLASGEPPDDPPDDPLDFSAWVEEESRYRDYFCECFSTLNGYETVADCVTIASESDADIRSCLENPSVTMTPAVEETIACQVRSTRALNECLSVNVDVCDARVDMRCSEGYSEGYSCEDLRASPDLTTCFQTYECAEQDLNAFEALGEGLLVTGTTEGAADNYDVECETLPLGYGAPERVYRIIARGPISCSASTGGSAFDTVLYVRSYCEGGEIACNDDAEGAVDLTSYLFFDLAVGDVVFLVVDGYAEGSEGAFELRLRCAP